MPLFLVNQDITTMQVDAIVNAANESLLGGGGVDGAIHRAAGRGLYEECLKLNGCSTGDAKITNAYKLPCKKVIHTVGPIWQGGEHNEEKLLSSCYKKSLELAKENGLESIAFPLISSGVYGYPKDQAIKIAKDTIIEFISKVDITVYLVIFNKESFLSFDDDKLVRNYISRFKSLSINEDNFNYPRNYSRPILCEKEIVYEESICPSIIIPNRIESRCRSIENIELNKLDESFSEMLFRLMDERDLDYVECYKKANIDRKVFSKINCLKDYRPSKTTAVAFAIALELSLQEAKTLIESAGYSLTHNNVFDVIIEYAINSKIYNVYQVNDILFEYDQKQLGS